MTERSNKSMFKWKWMLNENVMNEWKTKMLIEK